MFAALAAAKQSVRLEMYIFTDSALGRRFLKALVEAQRRGARVQVLVDALGSIGLAEKFWAPLVEAGGEFRWFNPLKFGRMTYRDHRKILVCDETTAFVGGLNIAPEYEGDGVTRGWRDLGIEITGALAGELAEAFDESFARADFEHRPLPRLRRSDAKKTTSGENWRLLLGGPGLGYNYLKGTLATDLANARRVQIVCAYFLPTWRIRRELLQVARRGGRVQLVLAGRSDVRLSQLASRRLYQQFLRAGVEIYEYEPQVLHAKLFLVDEQVYVGSSNLDARSLNINYELLVRLAGGAEVAAAREIFAEILTHCRRIEPAAWPRARSFWTKLLEDWAYFLLGRVDPYWARRRWRNLP